ncbi:TRAP transporter substrate-binding protein [Microbaculum marinum]|uniref:TRAP transporter substrate-binding protein n=1 Tax=Microbaculum marinum TaxID=1764581 RepID=A0AAW9RNX4_9HYPH
MNRSLGATLIAVAVALSAAPASAQTVVRVANWLPPQHPLFAQIIVPWTEQVEAATEGRVDMQILDAPLGPPPAHFDFAVNGVADVTFGVHNYSPGRFTATKLGEMAFLCEKSAYLSPAWWRIHQQYFADLNEHRGTKLLGIWTHGPGQLWTRNRDVTSLDAIKGAKIRIGGGFAQDVSQALELTPIQAPVTKAYEILSGGVADGIQFPAESVTAFKVDEVLTQGLIVPGGLYTASMFLVMNQAKWDSLSAEDQAAIESVSGEALAKLAGKVWDEADDKAFEKIEAAGKITLVTPDDAEMTAIKAALKPYEEKVLADITAKGVNGQEAYDALVAEIAKVKAGD